jgi:osmotically inducible protein OsmC
MRIIYRTPTVASIGGRDGSVRSVDGLINLRIAIPTEMDGPGGKTNPEELFAAGYAACFDNAVKGVAAEQKVAIGNSTVDAYVGIGPNDNGSGFILSAELHVTLPGADAEAAKDVVRTLPDDQQAIATAKQFVDGRAVELSSGTNLIARIDPQCQPDTHPEYRSFDQGVGL